MHPEYVDRNARQSAVRDRNFPLELQGALDLGELVSVFAQAIARDGAVGHVCHAEGGNLPGVPFGDMPGLALAGQVLEDRCLSFAVRGPEGQSLRVVVARANGCWRDRAAAARLHALAILYVHRALTLLEVRDDEDGEEGGGGICDRERRCLQGVLAGESWLDIGEGLGVSPHAVAVLLDRVTRKLGGASASEAVAIAVRRGICTT